ncbi:MAG TPA: D,D-dipeptide ABC transporter permease, partial [Thermoplasmata archaeon]|nr:D,D-dipeptide ABC transporter permease [Thermoplasmata archaeon]
MVSRAGRRATVFRERLRLDWRRFEKFMQLLLRNKLAVVGLAIILVFIFISVAAPLLVGSYPSQFDRTTSLQPPSAAHPFGTDWQGFDVLKLVV